MRTIEALSSFLDLLSAFSGITIGILFFTLKIREQKGNIYLALFILSLSIGFLEDFFDDEKLGILSETINLGIETDLFIIPSIFLYVLTVARKRISYAWLLLYLPGILFNFIDFTDSDTDELIQGLTYIILNGSLLFFSFKVLNRFKAKLKNYYSYTEDKNISWVKVIMIAAVFIHLYLFFGGIIYVISDSEAWGSISDLILSSLTFFIVYWVGYNGFQQIGYINEVSNAVSVVEVPNEIEDCITEEQLSRYKCCCDEIVKKKYFINPDLTLKLLSKSLLIKERELSELINSCSKKNFQMFINEFRVKEFKKLLNSDKILHYSILGLAKEAGFSSKSTFYKVFKQVEGVTPSEFKKQLKSPNTCSRTT